jgi:hypothetical protein
VKKGAPLFLSTQVKFERIYKEQVRAAIIINKFLYKNSYKVAAGRAAEKAMQHLVPHI